MCANQEPITSFQKKHVRDTCTHILVLLLPGSHYLLSADSLRSWMYVFLCAFATRAMLHLCTRPFQPPRSPPPPVLLSQASSRPELSIKLASYREQWSCGVCLGQCVHIDLPNNIGQHQTAMLVMMLFFQTKSFLRKKWLLVMFQCYSLL